MKVRPDRARAPGASAATADGPAATPVIPGRTWSIGTLVRDLEGVLEPAVAADAGREAREIVAMLLDCPRSWPARHWDDEADAALVQRARAAAALRRQGMPLPYAVGRAAFRHLTLAVDDRVLIPRPETEGLVDLVIACGLSGGLAVDVGTGSGAIALALAQEGHFDRVIGTDISTDALAVATANARRLEGALTTPVEFRSGAGLHPIQGLRARAIVSNPPYISWTEAADLPSSVRDWEPPVALFSDGMGLDITAALVRDAGAVLEPDGVLALEVDARRAQAVAALVTGDGRYGAVAVRSDLFGRERFVTARRTGD